MMTMMMMMMMTSRDTVPLMLAFYLYGLKSVMLYVIENIK